MPSHPSTSHLTPLLSVTFVAALAMGCGGASQSSVHFVAEDTFVVAAADIAESVPKAWVLPWRDPELAVRTAVALEHNCPLEGVAVIYERATGSSARFTVRVCGVERVYQEFEDLGFIDVSRAVASAIAPVVDPSSAAAPNAAPSSNPAVPAVSNEPLLKSPPPGPTPGTSTPVEPKR